MLNRQKKMLFEKQAEVAKAIAHPLRIAILDFLKDREQCVCDIAEHIGSEQSNVSRHLSVMVRAGVLECRKEGLKVIYRLKCPCLLDFFTCVLGVLKEQAMESKNLLSEL
ncbi:MAG: metalloregulator ArsR/SmtB family transcription factor [Phycisphaerae bacterium]|nr:metalloregulator ArsR/SmtB family transcription factor [Phycisphaerae bacterium]MDD5380736.1 metalloregulator ArsR/SmtB family transcription factor [Phycisphaerae bacterium]